MRPWSVFWTSCNGFRVKPCSSLLFFLVFLAACVAVAVLGFKYGHPSYFLYVYDEDGNACGKEGKYKDKHFHRFSKHHDGIEFTAFDLREENEEGHFDKNMSFVIGVKIVAVNYSHGIVERQAVFKA